MRAIGRGVRRWLALALAQTLATGCLSTPCPRARRRSSGLARVESSVSALDFALSVGTWALAVVLGGQVCQVLSTASSQAAGTCTLAFILAPSALFGMKTVRYVCAAAPGEDPFIEGEAP